MEKILELVLLGIIAYAAALYIYNFYSPYVRVKKLRLKRRSKKD